MINCLYGFQKKTLTGTLNRQEKYIIDILWVSENIVMERHW